MMTSSMCFDCDYAAIYEESNEWIECRCRADGKIHNPYRPTEEYGRSCPNFSNEEKEL